MAQKVWDRETFLRVGLHSIHFKNDQGKLSLQIHVIDGKPAYFFKKIIYFSIFSCTSFLCKEGSSSVNILKHKN